MNEQEQKTMAMEYVCGFLFDGGLRQVLLIRKNKPAWQAGKLNGVGGKIETETVRGLGDDYEVPAEAPVDAMVREFLEETGVHTQPTDWRLFRSERFKNGTGAVVHFFWASNDHWFRQAKTIEAEVVEKHDIELLLELHRSELMYNIPYLLEMALCYAGTAPQNVPAP